TSRAMAWIYRVRTPREAWLWADLSCARSGSVGRDARQSRHVAGDDDRVTGHCGQLRQCYAACAGDDRVHRVLVAPVGAVAGGEVGTSGATVVVRVVTAGLTTPGPTGPTTEVTVLLTAPRVVSSVLCTVSRTEVTVLVTDPTVLSSKPPSRSPPLSPGTGA